MGDASKNFDFAEFTRSETAVRLGLSNDPLPEHEANLRSLTIPFCQRVRDKVNCPITVTSGYRSPAVNKAVGGVPNSAHALGLAADISASGMTAGTLARLIASDPELMADADQIIAEISRAVVHVAVGGELRGQVLTQAKGPGTAFKAGVV